MTHAIAFFQAKDPVLEKIIASVLEPKTESTDNVFPYDDFHLKEIMVKGYNLDPNVKLKAQMIAISNDWGEHKSLAVRYLLDWKTFLKKGIN